MDYQPAFAELEYEHKKRKTRYRGLKKNTNRLATLAALANLMMGDDFCCPHRAIAPEMRLQGAEWAENR
ncbi:hypothetical protein AAIA72_14635 [Hahella sp. SMD15-11]|uniref:Uncharacterized protein n=1 Tax=Thermohahella caldifontis TaxID=3142973 RepID=A0AB39UW85_9GAMM